MHFEPDRDLLPAYSEIEFLAYSAYWQQIADSIDPELNETDFNLLDHVSDGLIDWMDILQFKLNREEY